MEYFISDTHFGHQRILSFERGERFKSIAEHDDFIMSLIEKKVKKDDTLYHLGDFMFGEVDEIIERWKKLPCKKILILGNHDKYEKMKYLFTEVHRYPLFIARNIVLSHEPIPVENYVLNVHGHLHSSYLDSENHLNVNIHMVDYKLFTIKDIENHLKVLPVENDVFLQEWYRDKYVFLSDAEDRVLDENNKLDVDATIELLTNHWDKKIINGNTVEVKKIAKRKGGESLYQTKDGTYYIGIWDVIDKEERFTKCVAVELSGPSRIAEKWEKCWVNGKGMSKIYPQEKESVKYTFYHIEKIYD